MSPSKIIEYQEKLASLDRSLRNNYKNIELLQKRGQILIHLNRYEEAVSTLRDAIAINASQPQVWLLLAEALEALQRYDESAAAYNRSAKLDPEKHKRAENDIATPQKDEETARLNWNKIFNSYYSALGCVELRHRDLIASLNDLQWSNEQFHEATKLAGKVGFKNTSDLPVSDLPSSAIFERRHLETSLSSARSKVDNFLNTQNINKATLKRLEQESQSKMSSLENNLRDVNKDIDDTSVSIENLKTQKMIEVLTIIGTGIVTVLVFPNIVAVIVAMAVMFFLRSL